MHELNKLDNLDAQIEQIGQFRYSLDSWIEQIGQFRCMNWTNWNWRRRTNPPLEEEDKSSSWTTGCSNYRLHPIRCHPHPTKHFHFQRSRNESSWGKLRPCGEGLRDITGRENRGPGVMRGMDQVRCWPCGAYFGAIDQPPTSHERLRVAIFP